MTFNEAKAIMRDLGYSIRRASGLLPGIVEYSVSRIHCDPDTGKVEALRWCLTADSIKGALFRAMSLSGVAIQEVTVTDITTTN